jgi:hypothetical protein
MLAKHLVGIELFRPRQRSGFRDGREEAVPRDYRGNRVKGVLFVVARRDQSGADAGVEADLLVDGAAISLKRPPWYSPGMVPLCLLLRDSPTSIYRSSREKLTIARS